MKYFILFSTLVAAVFLIGCDGRWLLEPVQNADGTAGASPVVSVVSSAAEGFLAGGGTGAGVGAIASIFGMVVAYFRGRRATAVPVVKAFSVAVDKMSKEDVDALLNAASANYPPWLKELVRKLREKLSIPAPR